MKSYIILLFLLTSFQGFAIEESSNCQPDLNNLTLVYYFNPNLNNGNVISLSDMTNTAVTAAGYLQALIQNLGIGSIAFNGGGKARKLFHGNNFAEFFQDHEYCSCNELRVYISNVPFATTGPKYYLKGAGNFIYLPYEDRNHPIVLLHETIHWLFGQLDGINYGENESHVTNINQIEGVLLPNKNGCMNLMYKDDIAPLNFLLSKHQQKIINHKTPDAGCDPDDDESCFYQKIPFDIINQFDLERDLCCQSISRSHVLATIQTIGVGIITYKQAAQWLETYAHGQCMLDTQAAKRVSKVDKSKFSLEQHTFMKKVLIDLYVESKEFNKLLTVERDYLNKIVIDPKIQLDKDYVESRKAVIRRNLYKRDMIKEKNR